MDYSPPGSSVRGILQAEKLEWVAMPSSRDLPDSGNEPMYLYVSCIGRQVLYHECHETKRRVKRAKLIPFVGGMEQLLVKEE